MNWSAKLCSHTDTHTHADNQAMKFHAFAHAFALGWRPLLSLTWGNPPTRKIRKTHRTLRSLHKQVTHFHFLWSCYEFYNIFPVDYPMLAQPRLRPVRPMPHNARMARTKCTELVGGDMGVMGYRVVIPSSTIAVCKNITWLTFKLTQSQLLGAQL